MYDIIVENLSMIYKYSKSKSNRLFSRKVICENRALEDINFSIERGEIVGYVGLNGAGKTTTMKILSGIIKPTVGSVNVLGQDPFKRSQDFLSNISLVMGGKCSLYWDLTVNDSLEFNKKIYKISSRDFQNIKKEICEILDMSNILDTQVRRLSLGERMKAELLVALVHYPKVIFLDEPTIGLDIIAQNEIRKFLTEYNRKWESTIILTSHNIDDISEVCNQIMLLNEGKLIYKGKIKEFIKCYGRKVAKISVNSQLTEIVNCAEMLKLPIIRVGENDIIIECDDNNMQNIRRLWGKYSNHIKDININSVDLKDILAKKLL